MYLAGGASFRSLPEAAGELIGLFVAIPRIVFGPVFLVIEGATFLLVHERVTHQSFFVSARFLERLREEADYLPLRQRAPDDPQRVGHSYEVGQRARAHLKQNRTAFCFRGCWKFHTRPPNLCRA